MTPLGWGWAGFVWGYAVVWALINDRMKLAAYWILDRADKGAAPKGKGEHPPETEVNLLPRAARHEGL